MKNTQQLKQEMGEEGKILAVLDYVPDYRTKEQFEMFIDSRKTDILVLKTTIKVAQNKLKALKRMKIY